MQKKSGYMQKNVFTSHELFTKILTLMYSSKMLGCVSLENLWFKHSENQIGGGTLLRRGILTIVEVLPLGGTLLREGDTHNF